jgi:replicative DNA helicase
MSEIRKKQEEKILSILFNIGQIPKDVKTIIYNIFSNSSNVNIMEAIGKIHVGGKFKYDNIAFYLADKDNNGKWETEIQRIYDLNVPEEELPEIINSLKEAVLKDQINKLHKDMEEKVIRQGDLSYIEKIKQEFNGLAVMENNTNNQTMEDVLDKTMAKIQEGIDSDSSITGISTGLVDVDLNTGGLNATDLTIIAARPGQGKTSFIINLLNNFLINPVETLFFSAEMPSFQIGMRLLSMQAQVNAMKMRTPKRISESEMARMKDKMDIIRNAPFTVNDTAAISLQEITDIARKLKDEKDIKIIFVDYLQRLKYTGFGYEKMSTAERVGNIAMGLKELAKELEIPVIALAQLNRSVDKGGIPPTLSDLKDSGGIEQEADVVAFVHRNHEDIEDINTPHVVNYIIAKNRHGPLGFIDLMWTPSYTQFTDIVKESISDNSSPF